MVVCVRASFLFFFRLKRFELFAVMYVCFASNGHLLKACFFLFVCVHFNDV